MFRIRIASLNIQTLNNMDRRLDLVDKLNEQNIDIACLQETLFEGEGRFSVQNYLFYYKGEEQPSGKPKSGVGFVIEQKLLDKIVYRKGPTRTERIYHLILTLNDEFNIHVINVYAPHPGLLKGTSDKFYLNLKDIMFNIPDSETIFLIGDFNAHVGQKSTSWPNIIGDFGYGELNSNGVTLLNCCESFNLAIENTFFDIPMDQRHTFESTQGKTQIDLCIIRQRDINVISECRPLSHSIAYLSHRMLIVVLEGDALIQKLLTTERANGLTGKEKLLKEAEVQIFELDIKEKKNFKNAWKSFKQNVDSTLIQIIQNNESKMISSISKRKEYVKKWETEPFYNVKHNCKREYDKIFSEFSEKHFPKDEGKLDVSINNDSMFNDNFTTELGFEASKHLCQWPELSQKLIEETINYVISNTSTNFSILSLDRQDLFIFFQTDDCINLLRICWEQGVIPKEILYAEVFIGHVKPVSNTMYLYSMLSEIFQHCIYRQLKVLIRELESDHYFFTSFSKRELLFSFTLLHDWIRAADKPVWIALLDFSNLKLSSNTDVIINYLKNEGMPNHLVQILKFLLVKCDISTNLNKKNDENIYKIVMQFFWSILLSECFPDKNRNTGINFIRTMSANPFNQPSPSSPLHNPLRGFVFVDLILFMAHSEEELKNNLQCFRNVLDQESLDYEELKVTISANKPSSTIQGSSTVYCFGKQINLSPSVNIIGIPFGFGEEIIDIFSRIEIARKEKKGAQYSILPNEDINITIKRYMINILEPLLLNLDILPIDSTDKTLLTRFHDNFLRDIQGRKIFVRKSSVLATKRISTILSYKRLVLFGDVCRLSENNKAKRFLYGDFDSSDQPKSFLNLCFSDLEKFQLNCQDCVDRDSWIQRLDSKLSDLE